MTGRITHAPDDRATCCTIPLPVIITIASSDLFDLEDGQQVFDQAGRWPTLLSGSCSSRPSTAATRTRCRVDHQGERGQMY
jgi:hypothetical protein